MTPKPTDYLITPYLNKPGEWTYPINHDAIRAMQIRVGRDHEETTKKLTDVIGGRTVALLLNGASIKTLEDRIEDFAHFNLCFMGINRFSAIEQNILFKIGEAFDIIFCMSEQDIPRRVHDIMEFLHRNQPNLVMTTLCAMTWLEEAKRNQLLDMYGGKLYLMPRLMCRPAYPISLEVIIDELTKAKVGHLILFGADGYLEPGKGQGKSELEIIRWNQQKMLNTYYDAEFFKNERRATGVGIGTMRFNKNFRYQPDKIKIMNCSIASQYEHIPRTTYDALLGTLAVGGL